MVSHLARDAVKLALPGNWLPGIECGPAVLPRASSSSVRGLSTVPLCWPGTQELKSAVRLRTVAGADLGAWPSLAVEVCQLALRHRRGVSRWGYSCGGYPTGTCCCSLHWLTEWRCRGTLGELGRERRPPLVCAVGTPRSHCGGGYKKKNHCRPWSTMVDHDGPRSILVDHGRPWSTKFEHGRS